MWDDAKRLNRVASGLAIVVAMAGLSTALLWLAGQRVFAFREVHMTGPLKRASAAHVEAVIREELLGTFFTMNLAQARRALHAVPWIRTVELRRLWPHHLEVTVEEHEPLARWNDSELVNMRGEVFSAFCNAELPLRSGPAGRAAEVATQYRAWSALMAPLAMRVVEVRLSERGSWLLRAAAPEHVLILELGREEPQQRLARFVAAHSRTIGALARAGTRVQQVDLRYRNGFAARVPGFRERIGQHPIGQYPIRQQRGGQQRNGRNGKPLSRSLASMEKSAW